MFGGCLGFLGTSVGRMGGCLGGGLCRFSFLGGRGEGCSSLLPMTTVSYSSFTLGMTSTWNCGTLCLSFLTGRFLTHFLQT